jgi:adenylate kinase
MILNVVIFGAPGSGKGTQSAFIEEKYGLEHLSTGDLLRAELKTKSDLAKSIDFFVSKGDLVPDKLIIDMLAKVLDTRKSTKGYIFDGFPRTIAQAETLEDMLTERGMKISVMLDLNVDGPELINRLLKRGLTSGRSDDNLETVKKRIQVYHSETAPVKDFYKKEGLSVEINGVGSTEEIFGQITKAIDAL